MKMNRLGKTDLMVSELCLGTMTFGNQTPEADAHAQIEMAQDAGITFMDAAEMYPVNPVSAETVGRTEEILGNWFEKTGRRNDWIVATKHSGAGMKYFRDGAPITTTENFEAGPAITQGLHADLLIVRHDDDGTTTAVANASVEVPPVGGALSHAPLIFLERPDVAMPGTYAIVVQAWREATDATPASSWTISLPLAITE